MKIDELKRKTQSHFYRKGIEAILIKDYTLAETHFSVCIGGEDKNSVDSYFYRAWCRSKMGKEQEAIEDYLKCIANYENAYASNSLSMIYNNLSYAYFKINEIHKAEKAVEKAVKLDENNFNAWSTKGEMSLHIKMYDRAINELSRAINIERNYSRANRLEPQEVLHSYYLRAMAYIGNCNFAKAMEDLEYLNRFDYKDVKQLMNQNK